MRNAAASLRQFFAPATTGLDVEREVVRIARVRVIGTPPVPDQGDLAIDLVGRALDGERVNDGEAAGGGVLHFGECRHRKQQQDANYTARATHSCSPPTGIRNNSSVG